MVSVVLAFVQQPVTAGPFETTSADHYVPVDKGLSAQFLASLYEKGESTWYTGDDLPRLSMPVNGIAAGQVNIRGDGKLVHWDIFSYPYPPPTLGNFLSDRVIDQGFALRVKEDEKTTVRPLDADGFAKIRFCGEYPIATVEYTDETCPVSVRLKAFSPFIPLNATDSALPAVIMQYTLRNESDKTVQATLAGWLENAVCPEGYVGAWPAARFNEVHVSRDSAMLACAAKDTPPEEEGQTPIVFADFEQDGYGDWYVEGTAFGSGPSTGVSTGRHYADGFKGTGFVNSYTGGDVSTGRLISPEFTITRPFISFLIGGGRNETGVSVNLVVDGATVRSAAGDREGRMDRYSWYVADLIGQTARIEIVDKATGRWGHICVDQIEFLPAAKPLEPVIFEDFEREDYGSWRVEGSAFGDGPADGPIGVQWPVPGVQGTGFANSFHNTDSAVGRLISPDFTIRRPYISFLIGGGGHEGKTCINLVVDGKVVRSATGQLDEQLLWHNWDVTDLIGKLARIEIVDQERARWGHISVDRIEFRTSRRLSGFFSQLFMPDRTGRWRSVKKPPHWPKPDGPLANRPTFGTLALALLGEPGTLTGSASLPDGPMPDGLFHDSGIVSTEPAAKSLDETLRGALASTVSLEPGTETTMTFIVTWCFPNRVDRGQFYGNRFSDAREVATFIIDNRNRLVGDTLLWHDTYYDSSLPHWLLDRLHGSVTALAAGTCQWWRNGRFWTYEGVLCCPGTCTHVWNYAQAAACLFPELERSMREFNDFDSAFDDDTGMVRHYDYEPGYWSADGQCGTVLKAYREHLRSRDDSFLRTNWPKIKRVLEYAIQQDANDNGVFENRRYTTYDCFLKEPDTFTGSLYLAALLAGERMATYMADPAFADRCRRLFEKGSEFSQTRLWNGSYFFQQVADTSLDQYGTGCLSGQLFGQMWARQLGLGYLYQREKVGQALESIWRYNWAPDVGPQNRVHKPFGNNNWGQLPGEAGLFNCTWPKGRPAQKHINYANLVWPGVEFQVSANFVWEGMVEEALAVCRGNYNRYQPKPHPVPYRNPWDLPECGHYYVRGMSSWAVLLAVCGFQYDGPAGVIGFAPRMNPDRFRAAFTTAEGWGTFSQQRNENEQTDSMLLRWGTLSVKTLSFELPEETRVTSVRAAIDGDELPSSWVQDNGRVTVNLTDRITIERGEEMEVRMRW